MTPLPCSFCGKNEDQVRKLIAGPGVYICDECIDLCQEILDEELGSQEPRTSPGTTEDSLHQFLKDIRKLRPLTSEEEVGSPAAPASTRCPPPVCLP